jgi:hypothetical protein
MINELTDLSLGNVLSTVYEAVAAAVVFGLAIGVIGVLVTSMLRAGQ